VTQYEEDLLIEINELSALIEYLKAENVELRSLLDEKKKEFQPLTWEQRGVPVL
jgi:cell shape-determining protein MreC